MKKKLLHTNGVNALKILLILFIFNAVEVKSQTIRYITPTGTGNGSSWTTASGDIQAMINASVAGDQVWVAGGTYKPNRKTDDPETITANDRNNSFVLKRGVKVYGSFAGTETLLSQRILPGAGNFTSILSGDYNGDDIVTGSGGTLVFSGVAENAYHVVVSSGTPADPVTSATVLDGFTITGGNANALDSAPVYPVTGGTAIENRAAGGIHNVYSSVIYSNLCITKNTARRYGGIYMGTGSTANFVNSYIVNNASNSSVGGIHSAQGVSGTYTNILFAGNRGGAGYCWGGTHVYTNCTVTNNDSGLAAAFYNLATTATYRNTVIKGNTPATSTQIMYNFNSTVTYMNSLVEGTSGTTNVLNGNLINTTDPMFNNSATGDYTPDPDSPLVNAGNNNYFAAGQTPDLSYITTDVAGNSRIQDVTIDIGAYEYTPCTITTPVATAQTACSTATVANLQVTLAVGATAKWYISAIETAPLSGTTQVTAGTYYVSQTIGTCESTRVPVIVTISAPQPQGATTQTYTEGETIANLDITVVAPAQIVWYANAALTTPIPATTPLVHNATYYAVATQDTCTSMALAVTVQDLAGTDNVTLKMKVTYYPNPVSDYITIKSPVSIDAVKVYNLLGQVLISEKWNADSGNLDVQQLKSGSYIVEAVSLQGNKSFRIVKK